MQDVDKRGEEVLSSLISVFIRSGCAVGSSTLASQMGQRFSSALVRGVMGDLEKRGLLTHRHTSGGRLPTDEGMRYYVDRLLKLEQMSDEKIEDIRSKYKNTSYNVTSILKETSKILSDLSNYAGLVVAPFMGEIVIKHLEFIPLANDRVLGIFVGRDGSVENRIIHVEEEFTYRDLEAINNYCNRVFYGLTLSGAKDKVEREIETAKAEYDVMINRALLLSQKMFLDIEKMELFVEGGSQLINRSEIFDVDKAASLMDMLEEKKRLAELLQNTVESEKINIFIGSESGYEAMSDCSVITASYGKDDRVLGALGVIGPSRMDYSKVIPIVGCTANLITDFLSGEEWHDGQKGS